MSTVDIERLIRAPSMGRLATAAVLIALILIVAKLLQRAATRKALTGSAVYRTRKIIGLSSYMMALLVLLGIFSDRLAGLGVALGVAGVGIANSFIFKEPVFNYSADFPFLWDEIKVPIRYGSDWEYTSTVLQNTLDAVCGEFAVRSITSWTKARERYALEDAGIKPLVTLIANDNWIEFTARYIVDYRQRRSIRDAIYRRFLTAVDQSGDRIRLASTTFEIVNFPRVDVTIDPGRAALIPRYVP